LISPNGIKAVLFDLDGTLRHSRPAGHTIFWEFAASLGAPGEKGDRRRAQQWAHSYWANSDVLVGDLKALGRNTDEFWQNYALRHLVALGCTPEQAQELAVPVRAHMSEAFTPEDWIPPEVPETLARLKSSGFTLGVVTNRSDPIDDYMKDNGLDVHLDFFFAAGEIGAWKPNPVIFEHALERAQVNAGEAIYVGDNYYADILGAQAVGIRAVLLDPDEIFPEADCTVIQDISEMDGVLSESIDQGAN